MAARKSFLIFLRIFFLIFSLKFLGDAFWYWDGYSYYMSIMEFLPDTALVYIFWTISGLIIASIFWAVFILLYTIIPKSLISLRYEHLMAVFIFFLVPFFLKRVIFSEFSISEFIGLSRSTILIIVFLSAVIGIWFLRKHRESLIVDKLLYGLNSQITPLVWFFTVLFVLSFPVSMFSYEIDNTKDNSASYENNSSLQSKPNPILNSDELPNIVIVIMDSLTTFDMQAYGYERPTTPFISEWSKNAVVFDKVYASSNFTAPSTTSLLTGQRVWTHKVWYDVHYFPAPKYENNLPSMLNHYGYDVYGFVQNDWAHPTSLGINDAFIVKDDYLAFHKPSDQWFERFFNFFLIKRPIADKWFKKSAIYEALDSFRSESNLTDVPSEMVYDRFVEYISQKQSEKSKRPFFSYLHVYPPHFLYLPPPPFAGYFGDADKFNTDRKQWGGINLNAEYSPDRQDDVDIIRKRYDEFILYSDKQFEILMTRLSETMDMSNTIVILSSDHGQSFSHGYLAHSGPHLYESLVRVPLIIKFPDQTKGIKINTPIEQIDIAPTILDLLGISVPEWMDGRSILPLIEGKSIEPLPIISMTFRTNRLRGNPIENGTIAVWDGDYKLIYYLEKEKQLLFNLKKDPDETLNILNNEPEIGQRLIKLIDERLYTVNENIARGL